MSKLKKELQAATRKLEVVESAGVLLAVTLADSLCCKGSFWLTHCLLLGVTLADSPCC